MLKDLLLPLGIKTALFGTNCTRSIFCSNASIGTKVKIAELASVSLQTVEKQALPNHKPADCNAHHLGNYNNHGTGEAYRSLIENETVILQNGHAVLNRNH